MEDINTTGGRLSRLAVWQKWTIAGCVLSVAVYAVLAFIFGWNPVAGLVNGSRQTLGTLGPLGWAAFTMLTFGVRSFVKAELARSRVRDTNRWNMTAEEERVADEARAARRSMIVRGVALCVASTMAFIVMFVLWGLTKSYNVRHDPINRVLTVTEGDVPGYEPRLAFRQAEALLRRDMGATQGRKLGEVFRFGVSEGDTVVYKTCGVLIPTKRAGFRPARGVVCRTDSGDVELANFSGDVPSPEGLGQHRLANVVNSIVPLATFESGDVYAYIQDGEPFMVVPTKKMVGFVHWHHAWAGTIVFSADGSHELLKRLDGSIPGPAVGMSMADEVLNGLNSRGSWSQRNREENAYDLTVNSEGDDEEAIEAGSESDSDTANVKHLLLTRADGSGEFLVTMLTPKGSSGTPTALLEVSLTDIEVGEWPRATLYQLPATAGLPRASNPEVLESIRNLYGPALQLADSGNGLIELTPLGGNLVRVTVGTDLVTLASVEFDQVTRRSCVYRTDGELVRCYDANTTQLNRDALVDLFTGAAPAGVAEDGTVVTVPVAGFDVSSLDDAELIRLMGEIADELAARQ